MPRLNDSAYQDRRTALRTDWDTGGALTEADGLFLRR